MGFIGFPASSWFLRQLSEVKLNHLAQGYSCCAVVPNANYRQWGAEDGSPPPLIHHPVKCLNSECGMIPGEGDRDTEFIVLKPLNSTKYIDHAADRWEQLY